MDKEAKSMDVKAILNPKIWLVVTGLIHAGVGVLSELDMGNETQVVVSGFFLLTTFTMLYAAFFTEGEQQANNCDHFWDIVSSRIHYSYFHERSADLDNYDPRSLITVKSKIFNRPSLTKASSKNP